MLQSKMKKATLVILMLLCATLLFTSCGKSYNDAATDDEPSYPGDSNDAAANKDYGYGSESYPSNGDSIVKDENGETVEQKFIRTVYMDAQTKEFDSAVTEIRAALQAAGGYEESFRTTGRSYGNDYSARYATMTLRIPAEKLDAFLSEVGGMVHVTSQNGSLTNVTTEYYDIEARLNVLESERIAYEAILEKADNTTDAINIRTQLYNVIEEIEAYKTRLRVLDGQVSYSTVTMSLHEVIEYSKVQTEEPDFIERVTDAFTESWMSFADNAQDFAVWLVGALPTLLVLALIGGVVIIIVVKMNRKHARPAKKKEAPAKPVNPPATDSKE